MQGFTAIGGLPRFLRSRREFVAQWSVVPEISNQFPFGKLYPCLTDHTDASGDAKGHYFHQDLLVAQRIFQASPERHIDVGSRVDGFVAHVAAFRPIEVLDIRPLVSKIRNIEFRQADLMSQLPNELHSCTDSLSCLHTLEHFGLGRYGDPIDPQGHLKGISNLTAILRPGGTMYLSVPIGPQRIEFNAHRVFSVDYLRSIFAKDFEVLRFSFVDDLGDLHDDQNSVEETLKSHRNLQYGCGIFELQKKSSISN